ncbi:MULTISPECIES: hypothetical protein [Anaerostipes]|uniref:Uncharacterized protein n=1 Tax=Anaerostipes amylophilus TaxID=2981779 RepID=A0ABV1ITV8_9FIRM
MENLLYGKQIEEKHYDAQLLAKGMKKEKIRHLRGSLRDLMK